MYLNLSFNINIWSDGRKSSWNETESELSAV